MNGGKPIDVRLTLQSESEDTNELEDLLRGIIAKAVSTDPANIGIGIVKIGKPTFEAVVDLIFFRPRPLAETLKELMASLGEACKKFFKEERPIVITVVDGERKQWFWKPKPKI